MINKEEFKTLKNVFDLYTERNLFKLISQGYFEGIKSPLKLGKEANIFSAERKDGSLVIIKIYRLTTCDFNRMYDYLKYDPRYENIKGQRRQIIFNWAQREYRNLLKTREIGITSPTPYVCKDNIVVMEFIGDSDPAPQLKDAPPKNPADFFNQVINQIKLLYKNNLVHADLSKFNILNHHETPVLIDFSQTTPIENPRSEEYFNRDIKNVCDYFRKLKVQIDEDKIKEEIKKFKNKP
ncbi:serine protein kinase RIO [archaeon]|nr:serine protein kinase RIO [archaeon]